MSRRNTRSTAAGVNPTNSAGISITPLTAQQHAVPLPNLPDPTVTIGQPFNPPLPVDDAAIAAARQDVVLPSSVVNGFTNRRQSCYRIAVLTMLISCQRLMGWIDKCHHPQVDAFPIALRLVDPAARTQVQINNSRGTGARQLKYTNLLLELHAIWKTYWSNPSQPVLDTMLTAFGQWTANYGWKHAGQQDAEEYLSTLLVSCEAELQNSEGITDPSTGLATTTPADRILQNAFQQYNNMTELVSTVRGRCVTCGHTNNVMVRNGLDKSRIWQISIPPATDSNASTLTLEQCIDGMRRQERFGWSCDTCNDARTAANAHRMADAITNGNVNQVQAAINQETNQRLNIPDYQWRYVRDLPEVLLMRINRFTPMQTKDNTPITISESLDLASSLEDGLPSTTVTKYRLSGLVSHAGDLSGGHYISYIHVGGNWFKINDRRVSQIQFDDIHNDIWTPPHNFTPYILLWEKDHSQGSPQGTDGAANGSTATGTGIKDQGLVQNNAGNNTNTGTDSQTNGASGTNNGTDASNTTNTDTGSAAATGSAISTTAAQSAQAATTASTSTGNAANLPPSGTAWLDITAVANRVTVSFPTQTVSVPPHGQVPRLEIQCQIRDEHGNTFSIVQAAQFGWVRLTDGNTSLNIQYQPTNPTNSQPAATATNPLVPPQSQPPAQSSTTTTTTTTTTAQTAGNGNRRRAASDDIGHDGNNGQNNSQTGRRLRPRRAASAQP